MSDSNEQHLESVVRIRLIQLAKTLNKDVQLTMLDFANERFLYRLGISDYADQFVLKGATLFRIWNKEDVRATKDLDFSGHKVMMLEDVETIVKELCGFETIGDGIRFSEESVRTSTIRHDIGYGGVRVKLVANLVKSRMPMQIDIGFGDVNAPYPVKVEYPTLLDFPAPKILAYPPEIVVAEKFQILVDLGLSNSRMKDFFDLWVISETHSFDGKRLTDAIRTTFDKNSIAIPKRVPIALTSNFSDNSIKKMQWQNFVTKLKGDVVIESLNTIQNRLRLFLLPPVESIANDEVFDYCWNSKEGWKQN